MAGKDNSPRKSCGWNLERKLQPFGCGEVNELASSAMIRRKVSAERNERGNRLRFTPEEIVRAIAGVEAAGLQVFGVEITPTGAINISTGPRAEASPNDAKRESLGETLPTKKNKQA